MVHGGGAVATASRLLGKRAAHIGAWLMQADAADVKLADGRVIAGNSSIALRDVARAWYMQPQTLPPDIDTGGLDVTAGYHAARDSGTFTYATHAAVVAVDTATGLGYSASTISSGVYGATKRVVSPGACVARLRAGQTVVVPVTKESRRRG